MTSTSMVATIRAAAMRKTATLNLRVSVEFKKRLIEAAKKEQRSVTNYLEATLSSMWDEQQRASIDRPFIKKTRHI